MVNENKRLVAGCFGRQMDARTPGWGGLDSTWTPGSPLVVHVSRTPTNLRVVSPPTTGRLVNGTRLVAGVGENRPARLVRERAATLYEV